MIWKRMSAVFFIIVAVHADGGNDFSNTLLRVQAEEPAGRIIFVNQIYSFRQRFFLYSTAEQFISVHPETNMSSIVKP